VTTPEKPTGFIPDPDFPTLPFVSDDERCMWTEEQKFARHCQEIEANAVVFNKRLAALGPNPTADEIKAAADLPKPWMDRHGLSALLGMQKVVREKIARGGEAA
jgi:hypothetical protein